MTALTPQQMRELAEAPDENHWSAAARESLRVAADQVDHWIRVAARLGERLDDAPHDRRCSCFIWNGTGWDVDETACDCWRAE